MVRCIIYTDGEKTQESVLAPGEHTVGRSRSADIHLAQPDISGKHLKLEVRPDGAAAENLSSHGTLLNGEALNGKTELKEGDRLSLGKHIGIGFSFSNEKADAAPAPAADAGEAPTLVPGVPAPVPPAPAPASAPAPAPAPATVPTEPPPAAPAPAPAPEPSSEEKTPVPGTPPPAEEDVLKTDVMRTRLASMEEMNLLRNADRKRSTGRTFKYVLAVLAAAALLAVLYTLKSPPREAVLSWPVGPDGKQQGAFFDPGTGGHRSGGFSLAYPAVKGQTKITEDKAKKQITILTRCGKDGSVPLRIYFFRKQSPEFLTLSRREVLFRMLAGLQTGNKRWTLAQISDVFFIGAENGLPCLSVEYRREVEGRSWYGEVLFFRTGNEGFLRLAEIPASERARGQGFISNMPFLKFSQTYLQRHWEGDGEYRYDGDPGVMMDEISRHLSKQAPFEWARTYLLLQRVLMESCKSGDASLERNALTQLRRLRSMQTVWYNGQKIQYNTAKLSGDQHTENAVMELCKTVFSSPDDLRYFTLRRNIWE